MYMHTDTQSSHTLLSLFFYTGLLRERLTGHCKLLLCLWGSSKPVLLSSSKLRLRPKDAASCWWPPERLLGSAWCTTLPCSLAARDSSRSRAWLSVWRCCITWEKTLQYLRSCLTSVSGFRVMTYKVSMVNGNNKKCVCEAESFLKMSYVFSCALLSNNNLPSSRYQSAILNQMSTGCVLAAQHWLAHRAVRPLHFPTTPTWALHWISCKTRPIQGTSLVLGAQTDIWWSAASYMC